MPNWTSEQKEAIVENGNIIVSAGAGSGKTAVLSARVIRHLNERTNINELLILTFTKAAANEMKQRIKKLIKEDISLKKQLSLIDSSYITTFDSFALSVVKKYHYLLNLSPSISIIDNTFLTLQKEKILEDVFNKYYEEKNDLFLKLVGDLCLKDDKDIRNYILGIDKYLNLKIDKNKYIDTYKETFESDEKINHNINLYIDLIKERRDKINDILSDINLIDSDFASKLKLCIQKLLCSDTYEQLKINCNLELPKVYNNCPQELKDLKDNLKKQIDEIKILCKYENIDDIKSKIGMSFDYVTIIFDIIRKMDNKLKLFKERNNLFEFSDVVKMSIKILENNESVKQELKNSFKEIMIDEYQDTNDLQEYFISLIENNNVYMVGDIKQSIYRFRNANPNIFKNKYDRYSLNNGGIKIDLNKNFRSRKEVLDDINIIFNNLMDGIDYKNNHKMIFGNLSYEENKPAQNYNLDLLMYDDSNYPNEEIEFFYVLRDIMKKVDNYLVYDKDLKAYRKCRYSDFVILMDRESSFDVAKKIFEYHNIPLTIYKDENIRDSYERIVMQTIISLCIKQLKCEYDDEYKYLFVSLARSFIFEYSDNDIFNLISDDSYKLDDIILKIKKVITNSNNITITILIDRILEEFNLFENLIKLGNISDAIVKLENLNDIGKSLEDIGYTIYDFDTYLREISDKKYEVKISGHKDDSESVKIMNIHKSKGLEFPICYFLGLYKEFNLSDIKEKFICSDNYGIIGPYYENGIGKTIYFDLLKRDYLKEEIEEKKRLFYVALTRCKEKMVMLLPLKDKKNKEFKSFADFIYSLDLNYDLLDINTLNITKNYNLTKISDYKPKKVNDKLTIEQLNIDYTLKEKKKFSKTINKILTNEEDNSRKLGLEFHEILEYLDFKNPDFDIINDRFLSKKVQKFIDLLPNIDEAKIYKELEFCYKDEHNVYNGIMDLVLEYDNHIDIIDYKLKNIQDENYLKQLNGYKNYLKRIKDKKINLYLYSILDEKFEKL